MSNLLIIIWIIASLLCYRCLRNALVKQEGFGFTYRDMFVCIFLSIFPIVGFIACIFWIDWFDDNKPPKWL